MTYQQRRLKVYVAGPILLGDRYTNIHRAIEAGRRMVRDGLAPFVPHLDAFMFPSSEDITWKEALEWDVEFVAACDVVYRLEGESKGADLECQMALDMGKSVYAEDEYDLLLKRATAEGLRWAS